MKSFPLNRCRGFAGDVVADAVDAADFVDDADGDAVEDVVGDARPVGGHEIAGVDSTQSKCVIIRPTVAHDADGAHGGQNGEILAEAAVKTSLGDLVTEDEIRVAQRIELFLGDIADHADGEAGAGEGLPHDQIFRQSQLAALSLIHI